MGLLYGLIAVGLALIFGLMDVVNFAHGEFLMIAMYVSFFLFTFFAIDPLLSAPLVAAALFVRSELWSIYWSCASPCGPRPMPAWCRSSRPLASPS
ncbi:branched-subunit amino acid ABC-type transport system permease component [Bradyrhizobium sp. LM2.9]